MPIPIEEQFDWENYVNKVYRESLKHSNKPKQTAATAKQNPQPADKKAEKTADSGKYGLIAGVMNSICCLAPNGKKILTNTQYKYEITSFTVLNNILYHCTCADGRVYETITGKIVFMNSGWLEGLAAHNGKLYASGNLGVFDVSIGATVYPKTIRGMVSYDSKLIGVDCAANSLIDVLNGRHFWTYYSSVESFALAAHNNKLYLANRNNIIQHEKRQDILASRTERAFGNSFAPIWAMASHNGKLYDGCGTKVFDTLNDPTGSNPLWVFDKDVSALASVPMDIWNKLAENRKIKQ